MDNSNLAIPAHQPRNVDPGYSNAGGADSYTMRWDDRPTTDDPAWAELQEMLAANPHSYGNGAAYHADGTTGAVEASRPTTVHSSGGPIAEAAGAQVIEYRTRAGFPVSGDKVSDDDVVTVRTADGQTVQTSVEVARNLGFLSGAPAVPPSNGNPPPKAPPVPQQVTESEPEVETFMDPKAAEWTNNLIAKGGAATVGAMVEMLDKGEVSPGTLSQMAQAFGDTPEAARTAIEYAHGKLYGAAVASVASKGYPADLVQGVFTWMQANEPAVVREAAQRHVLSGRPDYSRVMAAFSRAVKAGRVK